MLQNRNGSERIYERKWFVDLKIEETILISFTAHDVEFNGNRTSKNRSYWKKISSFWNCNYFQFKEEEKILWKVIEEENHNMKYLLLKIKSIFHEIGFLNKKDILIFMKWSYWVIHIKLPTETFRDILNVFCWQIFLHFFFISYFSLLMTFSSIRGKEECVLKVNFLFLFKLFAC